MSRYKRLRRVTYGLFTPGAGPDPLGAWVDLGIMLLIIANVTAVILGTVDTIAATAGDFLWYFEVFSVTIFTIEYIARVWSAVEAGSFEGPLSGRVEFASRPLMIIDLLAILPFYLTVAGLSGVDLRLLRALRLVRLFRLLKLARYSTAMSSLTAAFRAKREKLVLTLFLNILLLVLASSAMYYAEHAQQPEEFSSIPATFYWGMVTLTTVGYGDVTPVTPAGQVLTGVIAILGLGLFALPTSILADGFRQQAEDKAAAEREARDEYEYCPHCGERLND